MTNEFESKIYLGKSENKAIMYTNIIFVIVVVYISIITSIKVLNSDMKVFDMLLFAVLFSVTFFVRYKIVHPKFIKKKCVVNFTDDYISMEYQKTNNKTKNDFRDEIVINYSDLESIQYFEKAKCVRFVGKIFHERFYDETKELLKDMNNKEEIDIYFIDEKDADELLKNIEIKKEECIMFANS